MVGKTTLICISKSPPTYLFLLPAIATSRWGLVHNDQSALTCQKDALTGFILKCKPETGLQRSSSERGLSVRPEMSAHRCRLQACRQRQEGLGLHCLSPFVKLCLCNVWNADSSSNRVTDLDREDVDRHDCGARIWDEGGGTVVRQARPWTWYNFLSVFVCEHYWNRIILTYYYIFLHKYGYQSCKVYSCTLIKLTIKPCRCTGC